MQGTTRRWLGHLDRLFDLGGGATRNIPMEGVRGIAVALVFFVHFDALFGSLAPAGGPTRAVSSFLGNIGHAGVDLFFVLSGYLIYGTLIVRAKPFFSYFRRRIERIYPTFLAVFAAYIVLSWLVPERSRIPEEPGRAALYLLQNLLLLPGIFPIKPMIAVAWSLSYEFFFYLLIPLLIAAFTMRRWSPGLRASFFGVLAVACTALALAGDFPRVRLVMFAAGIVLFEILRNRVVRVRTSLALDGFAVGATAIALTLMYALRTSTEPFAAWPESEIARSVLPFALLLPAFFFFTLACFLPGSALGVAVSWTPLRWLGNMSYSFYLVHGLAMHPISILARKAGEFPLDGSILYWASLPVAFAAACVLSLGLFAMVEKPFSLAPTIRPAARSEVSQGASRRQANNNPAPK